MHPVPFRLLAAAGLIALGLCGCGQHTVQARQSLARTGAALKTEGVKLEADADRLDAYIGDKFAGAEAALARKRDQDDAAPASSF